MPSAKSEKTNKQNQPKKPESTNLPKEQALDPIPDSQLMGQLLENAAAAPSDPPSQTNLLQDARIPRAQRQALAARVGRVGGNLYLQRAVAQRENLQRDGEQTIKEQLREAMEGLGTDEDAIFSITATATPTQKAAVLADAALMAELRDELSGSELLRALNNLGAPLPERLRLAMAGIGTDEDAIFAMLGAATAAQKAAVLADSGLMDEIRGDMSGQELLQVLILLGAPLADRLRAAMAGLGTDEDAIFAMLGAASAAEKAAVLADEALMAEIRDDMSGGELIHALTLLGAPLADRLRAAIEGIGTDEDAIFTMLGTASAAEKAAVLADAALMSEIRDDMSGEELLQTLTLLGAPLADRLTVLLTDIGPDTNRIQTILSSGTEAERLAALADASLLALLKEAFPIGEFLPLMRASNIPFKRIIELALDPWEAGFEDVRQFVSDATDAETETVWSDTELMDRARARFGAGPYLDFLVTLRMFQPGTTEEDNATHTSAAEADEAIREHLEAYVGDAVTEGRGITGMVAVVDDADWDRAGINRYGAAVWNGGKRTDINGFVDIEGRVWIHRNRGNAGTMIHEAVHKYSTEGLINISQPLNEGVTEYFTRLVCAALTPPITGRGNYQSNYEATLRLVAVTDEQTVASAYFDGNTDGLRDAVVAAKNAAAWTNFIAHASADQWGDAVDDLN